MPGFSLEMSRSFLRRSDGFACDCDRYPREKCKWPFYWNFGMKIRRFPSRGSGFPLRENANPSSGNDFPLSGSGNPSRENPNHLRETSNPLKGSAGFSCDCGTPNKGRKTNGCLTDILTRAQFALSAILYLNMRFFIQRTAIKS